MPDELNEGVAYNIGRAFAQNLAVSEVIVGRDVRLDSASLAAALTRGITDTGVSVIDTGLCGTEEVYFQTVYRSVCGGIMITASYNPMNCNGMKLVRENARPISGDSGLKDIQELAESGTFAPNASGGTYREEADKSVYIENILGYVDRQTLRPLKIVINAGNGGAGIVIDELAPYLPFECVRIHHEPDGMFPHGIPNPLLSGDRAATSEAVRAHGADFGVAWDGDTDRCFFF